MDQAYQNFNAGKYKEALNNLSTNPINLDSYEPNLAICEYLANRCHQSANNCLRKLQDILARKFKRDLPSQEPHTMNIIKFNIAILLILQGKRDCALPLLEQIYNQRDCFVQFMQSRLLLLLMEIHTFSKNPLQTLNLHRYYLLKPDTRTHSQQWASLVLHEHGKIFTVAREEFFLMTRIYNNSALMQLGAPATALSHIEEDEKLREELLARARRRKNNLNKYYEINMELISRFAIAMRAFYVHNYQKCLSLMNFTAIVQDYEQMPTTKIVTNIISAFSSNNIAIVHVSYQMPSVALAYLSKAKSLLTKACTGVEDKDLHLISLNYGNQIEAITYNQALVMLGNRHKESYQYFQSIRKNGLMSRSYKFWYRMAQSMIQYSLDPKMLAAQRQPLLNSALQALSNSLQCLQSFPLPTTSTLKNLTRFTQMQEEQLEAMIMKMKSQVMHFKHSIMTLICYVGLGLKLYRRVVRVGLALLQDKKFSGNNRTNVLHYVMEAEHQMGKSTAILRSYLEMLQQELTEDPQQVQTLYVKGDKQQIQKSDYLALFYHQLMRLNLYQGDPNEALNTCEYLRQRYPTSTASSIKDAVNMMHLHYRFDSKFMRPYLCTLS